MEIIEDEPVLTMNTLPLPPRQPEENRRDFFSCAVAQFLAVLARCDGEVHPLERECLQDVLFQLAPLDESTRQSLEERLHRDWHPEEVPLALDDLLGVIGRKDEVNFIWRAAHLLSRVDGSLSNQEQKVIAELRHMLDGVAVHRGSDDGLILFPNWRRVLAGGDKYLALKEFGDFLRILIREEIAWDGNTRVLSLNLPQTQERKLCYAGALAARVIEPHGDPRLQRAQIVAEVCRYWDTDRIQAHFVAYAALAENARQLDRVRLCRGLYELTTPMERAEFIGILLGLAQDRGGCGAEGVEEVLILARQLRLNPIQFQEALDDIIRRWGFAVSRPLAAAERQAG